MTEKGLAAYAASVSRPTRAPISARVSGLANVCGRVAKITASAVVRRRFFCWMGIRAPRVSRKNIGGSGRYQCRLKRPRLVDCGVFNTASPESRQGPLYVWKLVAVAHGALCAEQGEVC